MRLQFLKPCERSVDIFLVEQLAARDEAAFDRGKIDHSMLTRFDEVADSIGRSYPEILGSDESEWEGKLFDLLSKGNRKPMDEDTAYEHALDHLLEHKHAQPVHEPVPFSAIR